jgi:hypothetical protein
VGGGRWEEGRGRGRERKREREEEEGWGGSVRTFTSSIHHLVTVITSTYERIDEVGVAITSTKFFSGPHVSTNVRAASVVSVLAGVHG